MIYERLADGPLIPTSTVCVTPTFYPKGWFVGRYDREGLVSQQRWFPTIENAIAYALALKTARR